MLEFPDRKTWFSLSLLAAICAGPVQAQPANTAIETPPVAVPDSLNVPTADATASPSVTPGKLVYLPDDEVILPPYLKTYLGGDAVNVAEQLPKGSVATPKKHEVRPAEWLEHGNRFDLGRRMAVQIFMNENCQVVGGGVLQMKVSDLWWDENISPYAVHLDRGWIRVWVKPGLGMQRPFRIVTPQGEWTSESGEFWVLIQSESTEIYVINGSVTGPKSTALAAKTYTAWSSGGRELFSKEWDEKPLEVRISALYPNLIKLSDDAAKDWEKNKIQATYAELRKLGSKRHSRFETTKP
jgi:hypothetical protein